MRETSDSGPNCLPTRLRGNKRAETVSGLLSKPVSTERPLAGRFERWRKDLQDLVQPIGSSFRRSVW